MRRSKLGPTRVCVVAACCILAAAISLAAQDAKRPVMPPGELVRAAVRNEVAAANNSSVKHMFRAHRKAPKGSQTRLYVETSDAIAAMLIAINDQPLTPQQQQ